MSEPPVDRVLHALQERAKELSCLYRIDELVRSTERPLDEVLRAVVQAIPPGWQYPARCQATITLRGQTRAPADFVETAWAQSAPIVVQGEPVGAVSVYYTEPGPAADEGPFLKEERQLITAIAERLAQLVEHRERTAMMPPGAAGSAARPAFWVILDLLHRTDQNSYFRIARRMLNHLAWAGFDDARLLVQEVSAGKEGALGAEDNRPLQRSKPASAEPLATRTFEIAAARLSEDEIVSLVQVWVREDRVDFLIKALEAPYTSLVEIGNSLERYQRTGVHSRDLSLATQIGLTSSLVRRLLTDQLEFINSARRVVEVEDFEDLLAHTVLLPRSQGRLGGKASGLFLASKILRRSPAFADAMPGLRIPRTWYLPSDGILHFVAFNDFDEVYAWKYRDIDQIRHEYPHMLQLFKQGRFPSEIVHGVARALDELGDRPLIVRSSSLLEDRTGSAFSGKYKSLFLANRGDKPARLAAVLDAIAEVYASIFGPDPIQYRAERGLLEHHEEMAIMIQEVVGTRVGRYFLPAFSGVGFSNNEFRWSPRVRRQDGLLRLVPGLGTRAVDRLADDYPVLVSPGQPGLRVNVAPEEVARYSPKKIDVIDLQSNDFVTLDVRQLLRETGGQYPALAQLVSVFDGDRLRRPHGLGPDVERDDLVFNFEGLLAGTPFLARMHTMLTALHEALRAPVDIEFASDGQDLYLLQCRPQSSSPQDLPAPIPRDLPPSKVLFSATRHISNGSVPDATHIVYVDPEGYSRLANLDQLRAVGRAVGRLNKLLPKRQFILMGPGRWGSRGDIHLGVAVTYADINNASVLCEIARKKGNFVPDLSFGTHFFQDLVEAQIRYLPLYPDDAGVAFNLSFFRGAANLLPALLPEFTSLASALHVIDVQEAAPGHVLRVAMNADLEQALGFLCPRDSHGESAAVATELPRASADHWRWRLTMAERLAAELDAERFGVQALYLAGSTKNATAGPGSDIDLLVHFVGGEAARRELEAWLQGWSLALAEINYLRTGSRSDGLLDVHFLSDDDIARQTSFAAKIGAVTDAARLLPLGRRPGSGAA